MEWHTVFSGTVEVALSLDENPRPSIDLTNDIVAAAREIRKGKSKHDVPMNISLNPDSIRITPQDSAGTAIYQPIGKVVAVHWFTDGTLIKSHFMAYITVSEDTRVGGPNAKYTCHLFKCRTEEEANSAAFAIKRTLSTALAIAVPAALDPKSSEQLDAAIKRWNNMTPPMLHYALSKDLVVTGNMKVFCQVDASLKTATKMVKLTSHICDNQLIELLAEKFNLSGVDINQYAVYDRRDSSEQLLLDNGDSPLIASLRWRDPSEGAIWLQKLPAGLVRVNTVNTARTSAAATPKSMDMSRQSSADVSATGPAAAKAASAASLLSSGSTTASSLPVAAASHAAPAAAAAPAAHAAHAAAPSTPSGPSVVVSGPAGSDASQPGPLLPYSPDDEDLLLSVMIARQSGTGLGFKLTPAYLLQMCISYCAMNLGEASLQRLLNKVVVQINTVVVNNPQNPEMLFFWLCNSMKLTSTLSRDPAVSGVYNTTARAAFEATIETALKSLKSCAASGVPLPGALERAEWATQAELRALISEQYRSLDSNMNADSLKEVVARITAAMPSPSRKSVSAETPSHHPVQPTPARAASSQGLAQPVMTPGEAGLSPASGPATSTPVLPGGGAPMPNDISAINGGSKHEGPGNLFSTIDTSNIPKASGRAYSPLPAEWEELVDQETQHRFFANHVTRQTSWTDPRDRLSTVTLTKGERGLGLGISGAKRTWDDRLVLGIFVSSLVPGSAAAVDGTLREGDEILEVNGHSLIGVSREGAIEFLKQVRQGDKVILLVAQEPAAKAALKQTAL